jgi:hypothetical protein
MRRGGESSMMSDGGIGRRRRRGGRRQRKRKSVQLCNLIPSPSRVALRRLRTTRMHSDNDEDYVDSPEELELDPNVFYIWNPLQKPVTLQYTTEQLHSEYAALCAPQSILTVKLAQR